MPDSALPNKVPTRQVVTRRLEMETAERLSRIDDEFADGYTLINKFNDTVTFFGSARTKPDDPYYQKCVEVAEALSKDGFTIVTGGGPGIMEAANKGAYQAGCPSIGLDILLPREQGLNPYVTDSLSFKYFFSRKVMLAFGATGYVYFPGGFGTLDEFFEIITLIQTEKMPVAPIILFGYEFWQDLDSLIKRRLLGNAGLIGPGDENLYVITEDTSEILNIMNTRRSQNFDRMAEPPIPSILPV